MRGGDDSRGEGSAVKHPRRVGVSRADHARLLRISATLVCMARRPDWVKVVETSAGRRYEVRVHAQRPDGTRFQQRRRFKSVEAAVAFRSTVVSEVARGVHVPPAELTVRQAVDSWLGGQRIRTKTYTSYVTNLRPLVDHLGDRRVQTFT